MKNIIKDSGKSIILQVLTWQLKRLYKKQPIKVVGVVGSYGKTSTKFAIAKVLGQKYRVNFQEGNYNDLMSVPLIFFNEALPSLLNPIAWISLLIRNEGKLRKPYPYDLVIVEMGADGPNQIPEFKKYLDLDFAVVTSIDDEHMEFFHNLQAVADEELSVANYSKQLIINNDLCDSMYTSKLTTPFISFGETKPADYIISNVKFDKAGYRFSIIKNGKKLIEAGYPEVSRLQLYSACAATIIGSKLGMTNEQIIKGIAAIKPVSGRMQALKGINGSTILDESYNSSPGAAISALDVLYSLKAPNKIAVLGNMNELGERSKTAHTEVGSHCDPKQLSQVITIGPDANLFLAKAAEDQGCQVARFDTPYEAGEYLSKQVKRESLILVKGSQNKVYSEEAIKSILANPEDSSLLVRQSTEWLKKKAANFK